MTASKSRYAVLGHSVLLEEWLEKMLPDVAGDRAGLVEGMDLVYLGDLDLERHRTETCRFLAEAACRLSPDGEIGVYVVESRPVSNPRLNRFLKWVASNRSTSEQTKSRVLHLANSRTLLWSGTVAMKEERRLTGFLESCLETISGSGFRILKSDSLPLPDVEKAIASVLPRRRLSTGVETPSQDRPILARSTNQILTELAKSSRPGLLRLDGPTKSQMEVEAKAMGERFLSML